MPYLFTIVLSLKLYWIKLQKYAPRFYHSNKQVFSQKTYFKASIDQIRFFQRATKQQSMADEHKVIEGQGKKKNGSFVVKSSKSYRKKSQIRENPTNGACHHLPIKHLLYNIDNIINKFLWHF